MDLDDPYLIEYVAVATLLFFVVQAVWTERFLAVTKAIGLDRHVRKINVAMTIVLVLAVAIMFLSGLSQL